MDENILPGTIDPPILWLMVTRDEHLTFRDKFLLHSVWFPIKVVFSEAAFVQNSISGFLAAHSCYKLWAKRAANPSVSSSIFLFFFFCVCSILLVDSLYILSNAANESEESFETKRSRRCRRGLIYTSSSSFESTRSRTKAPEQRLRRLFVLS
jgi:hypothetical protein